MALTSAGSKGTVRALYAYLSSGEHQMSFLEGDLITLLGDESIAFHGKVHQPSPVPIVQFRRSSTDGVVVSDFSRYLVPISAADGVVVSDFDVFQDI